MYIILVNWQKKLYDLYWRKSGTPHIPDTWDIAPRLFYLFASYHRC